MSVDERITTILVDTCAFRDANSDFIGISSMLLPSFFSVIKEKDILLLTHPILEREIEKHIEDSGIYKDYQSLVSQINAKMFFDMQIVVMKSYFQKLRIII